MLEVEVVEVLLNSSKLLFQFSKIFRSRSHLIRSHWMFFFDLLSFFHFHCTARELTVVNVVKL